MRQGKRGISTVDAEFLAQIEVWRELLAKTIALRNHAIEARDLNFAVQATIDRIVFLRICEDRGRSDGGGCYCRGLCMMLAKRLATR